MWRLGDDGLRAGADEPGGVVVDALDRQSTRPSGRPGLGVAAGVAQVVEQHDGVGREPDVVDRRLAEVLVGRSSPPATGFSPKPFWVGG